MKSHLAATLSTLQDETMATTDWQERITTFYHCLSIYFLADKEIVELPILEITADAHLKDKRLLVLLVMMTNDIPLLVKEYVEWKACCILDKAFIDPPDLIAAAIEVVKHGREKEQRARN